MEATIIKELPQSGVADLARENTALRAENFRLRKALERAEKGLQKVEMDRNRHAGQVRYTRRLWMAERERADKLEKYKSDCKMLKVGLVFVGLIAMIYFLTVVTGGWLLPR